MLSVPEAKKQVVERLSRFVGIKRSEDMLVELQNEVNALLDEWFLLGFKLMDGQGLFIQAVQIYTNPNDWDQVIVEPIYH